MADYSEDPETCHICGKPATNAAYGYYKWDDGFQIHCAPIPSRTVLGCDEHPAEPPVEDLGASLFEDWRQTPPVREKP